MLTAWFVALVLAGAIGSTTVGRLTTDTGMDESSQSYRAYRVLSDAFPGQVPDLTILYSSQELTIDDPVFGEAVRASLARIPADRVERAVSGLDAPPQSGLVSPDRHAVKVVVSLPPGTNTGQMLADADAVRAHAVSEDPRIRTDFLGIPVFGRDLLDRTASDAQRAELVSLPLVLVLSLLIFGGLVAALVPTLLGVVSIALSLGALGLLTHVTDVATQGLMVVTLLGMGMAIDYSLFVISRFREELAGAEGRDAARIAVETTVATAGRTVGTSALVVAASLSGLLVFPITTVRSMACGAISAVLCCALAAVTLLPALLALLGRRIDALRVPWLARGDDEHGFWAGVAQAVMRRPWVALVTSSLLLVALAAPFAGVRWGGTDEKMLPPDAPSRVAIDQEAHHFGGETAWAYAMVTGADPAALQSYAAELAAVDGVRSVVPTLTGRDSQGREVTMMTITWPGTPQSAPSHELVQRLRDVAPSTGDRLVGGPTAISIDVTRTMADHLPAMATVMVTAMLLLLGVAFRSVVIPVKAVVMAVLSLGASYGLLTAVFQDGYGASWLGIERVGHLDTMTPVVMAAVLFGLSMDYEVFMLSRMKEEWDLTGDNRTSVAHGLARTGRLITGAALLLGVVIGGFATSGIIIVKMMGLGMLVAVLLDATLVRGVLVPSTMRLLGRWNWWPGTRASDLAGRNLQHPRG